MYNHLWSWRWIIALELVFWANGWLRFKKSWKENGLTLNDSRCTVIRIRSSNREFGLHREWMYYIRIRILVPRQRTQCLRCTLPLTLHFGGKKAHGRIFNKTFFSFVADLSQKNIHNFLAFVFALEKNEGIKMHHHLCEIYILLEKNSSIVDIYLKNINNFFILKRETTWIKPLLLYGCRRKHILSTQDAAFYHDFQKERELSFKWFQNGTYKNFFGRTIKWGEKLLLRGEWMLQINLW